MKCKYDMRTKLVGDGCEACNPELAAEMRLEECLEAERERFEERVFARYFLSQIENTGMGGCLTFMPKKDTLYKYQLMERDGDDYKREDISAMWWGWRAALRIEKCPKNRNRRTPAF